MAYTYYISFNNSDWSQIYPVSSNKVKWERESGEIFMRPKIDELRIDGRRNPTVYATLATNFTDGSTFGNYLYFKIKRNGTDPFYFICSINDGKLDVQNKVFYCTPRPNDNYEKVLKGYNLLKPTPITSTFFYPTVNANVFIDQSGGIPPTWEDTGGDITWDNTDADTDTSTLAIIHTLTEGMKVIFTVKDYTNGGGNHPTLYAIRSGGATASNVATINADGKYILTINAGTAATSLVLSIVNIGSGSFTYVAYEPVSKSDGYPLESVINDFLGVTFLNTGLTAQSTILWNDALPSVKPPNIDTYITANPTNDYVLESAAIWNYIMLAKSDAITGDSADRYEITFKDLMDILKIKMRIYWYIDSGGYFRLEHEKYFTDFATQLDITSLTTYKPEVDKKVYNYVKSDIYSQVVYSESNEGNEDWLVPIMEYDLIKTTSNRLELTPPKLSTDVKWMIDNSSSADSSGYLLLQCIVQTGETPLVDVNESVLTDDVYYPNLYLSWAWLIKNYYSYFGDADEATIHVTDTLSLDSVKRFKKQPGVKFYYDGILNWLRPCTLAGGTGWIEKMELDLDTGWYNIDFEFDPY